MREWEDHKVGTDDWTIKLFILCVNQCLNYKIILPSLDRSRTKFKTASDKAKVGQLKRFYEVLQNGKLTVN